MKIHVKAYGILQRYLRCKKEVELCLEQGSTIATLFHKLKKPKSEMWMVSVNGKIANENTILNDGDSISIFEPVGGGK
jgi:molybdopterin converting factor small subunit